MIGLVGGVGFIGRALAAMLRAEGSAVVLMDRVDSGRGTTLAEQLGCRYRQLDLAERVGLPDAFAGCEVLVHLAWSSVPGNAAFDPVSDAQANVLGTLSLLEAAERAGVRRVIFLSSGGTVYGAVGHAPVAEDQPLRPISIYGAAKAAAEAYIGAYARTRRVAGTIVRLSNPYGPGQSAAGLQGAVAVFTRRILDRKPIELWGDGSAVRDYIHLDDAVRALALLCRRDENFGVYNVGSGQGLATLDLVRLIERKCGVEATLRHLPARDYDVLMNVLDCSRMRALGWRPVIELDAGLECVVAAMRSSG